MRMMFAFGKRRHEYAEILNDYLQRVKRFVKFETVRSGGVELCFVVAGSKSVEVRDMTSPELAEFLRTLQSTDVAVRVAYGSEVGPSERGDIEPEKGDKRSPTILRTVYISLTGSLISVGLAEVLAAEQIYRAFMILSNRKYHK